MPDQLEYLTVPTDDSEVKRDAYGLLQRRGYKPRTIVAVYSAGEERALGGMDTILYICSDGSNRLAQVEIEKHYDVDKDSWSEQTLVYDTDGWPV